MNILAINDKIYFNFVLRIIVLLSFTKMQK